MYVTVKRILRILWWVEPTQVQNVIKFFQNKTKIMKEKSVNSTICFKRYIFNLYIS